MKKFRAYIVVLILVFINIFFFSSISPIHSLMNLLYDQHVYNLIGKGIAKGLSPYVDLIDHKGIYLFLSYGVANLFPYKHIGLFIVGYIYFAINALYIYKISYLLFISRNNNNENTFQASIYSIITSLIITTIINTNYLSTCGLDCETMMIPFITMALYIMAKHILSTEKTLSSRSMFCIGICAGIIAFIKANGLLFFASIAIYLLIEARDVKKIGRYFVCGLIGMIIGMLPGIIYCLCKGCLYEMIYQSFILNMIYLETSGDMMTAFLSVLYEFYRYILVSIVGMIALLFVSKDKKLKMYFCMAYIFSLLMILLPLRDYTHYLILITPFFIPAFVLLFSLVDNTMKTDKSKKILSLVFLLLSIIICSITTYNFNTILGIRRGERQTLIASDIKKSLEERLGRTFDKDIDINLFVVGYHPYIYTYLDILPPRPTFAIPIIDRKTYSKPYDQILRYVRARDLDAIVLVYPKMGGLNANGSFYREAKSLLVQNYECINTYESSSDIFEVYISTY